MDCPTVTELAALSEPIIEAGVRSFTVRRVLQRIEAGELSVAEATAWLRQQVPVDCSERQLSGA